MEIHLDKPDDTFTLRPIGDVHAGNRGFDKEKFETAIKAMLKK